MVMRSMRVVGIKVPLRSRAAAIVLKARVERKFGHLLKVHVIGKCLVVEGDEIGNYKVRNWILKRAEAS
jgi:hypothetical protein